MQIWILAAQFEIRQFKLDSARKILGMAIGKCPKDKLFKSYIEVGHMFALAGMQCRCGATCRAAA